MISLSKIEQNNGQIEGLPTNPREWRRDELDNLKKSIRETPELLEARGLIVIPHGGKYIVLGGNMRRAALEELGAKEAPCIVVPADTETGKLKEIVLKDNGSFGAWDFDALANEWDDLPLPAWGVPAWGGGEPPQEEKPKKETEILSGLEYDPMYFEPEQVPFLSLKDCVDTTLYDAKMKALDEYDLTDEQRQAMKLFAYRFIKIDFEAVANYYCFQAKEEERKAIERLRLVLVDSGNLDGFVQDDLLRIANLAKEFALEEGAEDER
jgi:ParB-like nuclease domain.